MLAKPLFSALTDLGNLSFVLVRGWFTLVTHEHDSF